MPIWTQADLQQQLNYATAKGWIPFFVSAASANNFQTEFLLAIASHETNIKNIKGDLRNGTYHGFGIMQVDIGTDPTFCANWTPDDVQGSINRGAQILADKRTSLATNNITDLKAIAAAYNTGAANVIHSIQNGLDPDTTTTGHNYGSDIIARQAVFVNLQTHS